LARYLRIPGSRIEDLGPVWAAYSPASGETHLLNDEAALLLGRMADHGACSAAELAQALADDVGIAADELERRLSLGWNALLEAGLVRAVDGSEPWPP